MLRKKFFSKGGSSVSPGLLYYIGITRTGTGAATSVTTSPFQPDLVITRGRSVAKSSSIFDSVRTALKRLVSNSTAAEVTDTNSLTAFLSNGFSVGADTPATTNPSGVTLIHWCFKKVAGFLGIDLYSGTTAAQVVSHGLTVTPEMIIVKARNGVEPWPVYHKNAGGDIFLNTNAAVVPYTFGGSGTMPSTQTWTDCAYGNGVYVTVAQGTTIAATSTDSVNWTARTLPSNQAWSGVAFGNGVFVAISGSSSSYATSSDGITWSLHTLPFTPGVTIKFGKGVFLTGDGAGTTSNVTHYSTDGITWQAATIPWTWGTIILGNIGFDGTNFMLIGGTNTAIQIATSSDGISWTFRSAGASVSQGPLAGNGSGVWVWKSTSSTSSVQRTTDNGVTWTTVSGAFAAASNASQPSMDYGAGLFKIVLPGTKGYSSPDGLTWTSFTLPGNLNWTTSRYLNGGWVFLCNGSVSGFSTTTPSTIYNPTPTTFSVGTDASVAGSGINFVSYTFATLAGISKVGSYTGDGTAVQLIACGFSGFARFVMVKRLDAAGDWYVFDSARGYGGGNDPRLSLNDGTVAEVTTDDSVNVGVGGFAVVQNSTTNLNVNGASYIFYAIA